MKVAKHRRNLLKNFPLIVSSLLIFFIFFGGLFFISSKFFNNGYLLIPLAQNKIYKTNSIEDILQKNNIQFEKINASDSAHIVLLKDNGEVDISDNKNINSQISSLQLILSRLTIEGKKFKRLDLRFDKPIIEF